VIHGSNSFLDATTLRACIHNLPDIFLLGVGFNREEIENLQGIYGKAFHYYSCFISHSRIDDAIASRLHADLQQRGVSCWKASVDLRGGEYWQTQVDDAIRLKDKIVLICSEAAFKRKEVVREVLEAIKVQEDQGKKKLFPIRIDNHVLSDEFTKYAKEQVATGEWEANWLTKIRAFHIPDFTGWKHHDKYVKALDSLVGDLKKSGGDK